MSKSRIRTDIDDIDAVICSRLLAQTIANSVSSALMHRLQVHLSGKTVWEVFKRSRDLAIYDIENHERGVLFRRLIRYGSSNPDEPEMLTSTNTTTLSDPECGACVQFIYSHMVNRFKGELAELLALRPCIELVQTLQDEARLPRDTHLFWGELVQERNMTGSFTKGADGLLVQRVSPEETSEDSLIIHGVVEVKSYHAGKKAWEQIGRHCSRLEHGVKLGSVEYLPEGVSFSESGLYRILVTPSSWKLDRRWSQTEDRIVYHDPSGRPVATQTKESESGLWKITLGWSQEALEQAAYELTFWYMAEVGKHVFTEENKPKSWESMTREEAGRNAIKMMLYYLPLRPLTRKQEMLAIRLYNIYSFGYPLGIDHARRGQMIWLKDGELSPLKTE